MRRPNGARRRDCPPRRARQASQASLERMRVARRVNRHSRQIGKPHASSNHGLPVSVNSVPLPRRRAVAAPCLAPIAGLRYRPAIEGWSQRELAAQTGMVLVALAQGLPMRADFAASFRHRPLSLGPYSISSAGALNSMPGPERPLMLNRPPIRISSPPAWTPSAEASSACCCGPDAP